MPLDLNGEWTFRLAGEPRGAAPTALSLDRWIPATVPGTVHYQLQAQGKIPDPWFGRNELSQQWIDEQDWEWSRHRYRIDGGLPQVAAGIDFRRDRHGRNDLPERQGRGPQSKHVSADCVRRARHPASTARTSCACCLESPTAFAPAEAERRQTPCSVGRFSLADR